MFTRILVPVDLDAPDQSDRAISVAQDIARRHGARITVMSVEPMITDETAMAPPDYRPLLDAYVEAHRDGPPIEGLLRLGGSVSGEIRLAAEESGADLVVMGSHDPRVSDYFLGSNAAHVALHTRGSVLVVRDSAEQDAAFAKILVPVDLDAPQTADRAMAAAIDLARAHGAQILVNSVQPGNADRDGAEYEARLEAYLEARRADLSMDGVLTLGGAVANEIRYAAEEMGCDLIVMASHEPKLRDYLTGSNASHVALHTHCSVMVVR